MQVTIVLVATAVMATVHVAHVPYVTPVEGCNDHGYLGLNRVGEPLWPRSGWVIVTPQPRA